VLSLVTMGLLHYSRARSDIHGLAPFLSNFQLVAYLLPLPLSLYWVAKYLATLPKQAKLRRLQGVDSVPRWVALMFGLGCASLGLWGYGSNSVAAFALDAGAMAALAFSLLLPVALGISQGMERPFRYRVGYGALGLCFGVFQLSLPLALAVGARLSMAAAAVVLALLMQFCTWRLHLRWPSRYLLLGAFVLTGTSCLGLSLAQAARAPVDPESFTLSLLTGGIFTCIWLGFYLAVALAFGAHNNEAGGAARLDAFRHFVRFKVEPDRIVGYVIGFDRPTERAIPGADGEGGLRPRLVDRFELRCESAAPSPADPG